MTTREAIEILAGTLKEEALLCTTGYTCRDVQHCADRPANFYMIGSMGLAAPMGLGVALSKPWRRVVVFDGDGAVLMGLGALAMIGSLRPKNLTHVVFDNEVFASTGNQPTYSSTVPLDRVAAACGYPIVRRADSPEDLRALWRQLQAQEGPAFLLVKCRPDAGAPKERVRLDPEAITSRFRGAVHGS